MSVIIATLVYTFIALYLLIMAPIAMAWTILVRDTTFVYNVARVCVRIAGWMCRVRVKVKGREKITPGRNYVFLSNHQGNFDGPVLLHVIPRDFRGLVKKEMMRIPILSWVMKLVHFVPVDRSDSVRARASLDYGAGLLAQGYSFIAFPEGTRSRDGRLGPFKKGVFLMALKAGAPILPITILNTRRIQPPGAYGIRPGTVAIIFHDPIPTQGLGVDARDRIIDLTRAAIASGLDEQDRSSSPDQTSIGEESSISSP